MDLFIRRPPEFTRLYNCSFYDIDSVPLAERQQIPLGLAFLTLGLFEWILYIPCMLAIWRHLEHSCYKMMFYIGVLDMVEIFVTAIATGVLGMLGAVYCSAPNLIYLLGTTGASVWHAESTVEVMLALNRCIEICSSDWGDRLFKGWRTWAWMLVPTVYGLYAAWFLMAPQFSAIYFSWFTNPHIGYFNDNGKIYYNDVHSYHNYSVAALLTLIYASFAVILFFKKKAIQGNLGSSNQQVSSHNMIFVQVALISLVNYGSTIIYVYMQYFAISEWLIVVAQFSWFQAHGIPPVIYLLLNRTLRTDSLDIVRRAFSWLFRWRKTTVTAVANGGGRHITAASHHHQTGNKNIDNGVISLRRRDESNNNLHNNLRSAVAGGAKQRKNSENSGGINNTVNKNNIDSGTTKWAVQRRTID